MYSTEHTPTSNKPLAKILPFAPRHDGTIYESMSGLDFEAKKQIARSSYIGEVPMTIQRYREVLLGNYNKEVADKPEKPVITDVRYRRVAYRVPGESDINFTQTKYETVQRIEWSTMEQDFDAWQEAIELIASGSELSDDEFNIQIVPQLRIILINNSPLFRHMASGDIDVTNTHKRLGKTPYIHTFDVLMAMDTTDCINGRQRGFRRTKALFHDIGKSIVANHDFMQNHAAFSQSFFMEFARRKWSMSEAEALQFTLMERWHHTAELMDLKVLNSDDVLNEVYENTEIFMDGPSSHLETPEFYLATLCALNVADTESVKMYEYTAGAIVHTFELFKEVSERTQELPEPWVSLLSQLGMEGIDWLAQLQVSQAEIEEKIITFLQAIDEIVTGIKGLSPEAVAEFIYTLFDKAVLVGSDSETDTVPKQLAMAA